MMKRRLGRITALLLAVTLLLGAAPAYALGNVGYFGERGEELVEAVYDAAINFANVRNDKTRKCRKKRNESMSFCEMLVHAA